MTDNTSNNDNTTKEETKVPEWYTKPPTWYTQAPESKAPASSHIDNTPKGYGEDILQALKALPETLANTLKEQSPPPPPTSEKSKTDDTKVDVQIPNKKNFAEWWFGR